MRSQGDNALAHNGLPELRARTEVTRDEAILDLEVQGAGSSVLYSDVTVHNGTPGNVDRLTAAAGRDGAVNVEAERTKRAHLTLTEQRLGLRCFVHQRS